MTVSKKLLEGLSETEMQIVVFAQFQVAELIRGWNLSGITTKMPGKIKIEQASDDASKRIQIVLTYEVLADTSPDGESVVFPVVD